MSAPRFDTDRQTVVLCGAGHVSAALCAVLQPLGWQVIVIDDRRELLTEERFPHAHHLIFDAFTNLSSYDFPPESYFVTMTHSHELDFSCLAAILSRNFGYVGMLGSKTKAEKAFAALRSQGFGEDLLSRIHTPIGLPIGAVTPAEIALSILAQIVQVKNKTHAASIDKSLLEVKEPGMLCIILEKHGSAPRGVGSMMFVGQNSVLGSIGGGEPEYLAMLHAKEVSRPDVKEYTLNNTAANGLDMICGGRITVMFIPV